MMNNLKIQEIFNLFNENKTSEEILFLGKFDVTSRDIDLASKTCDIMTMINQDRGMFKIDEFRRGGKDRQIEFMGSLSQNHFSRIIHEKFQASNKRIKIKSTAVASYFVDKHSEDFKMIHNDIELNFDIKSQYFQSSSSSLNINEKAHIRFREHSSDFYIASIFRNRNKDYKNYEEVESVYYFLVSKEYVDKNAEKAFGKSPYFKIHIKNFIEKIA